MQIQPTLVEVSYLVQEELEALYMLSANYQEEQGGPYKEYTPLHHGSISR